MNHDALCFQSIERLAPQIKSGKLSPVTLAEAYLERIEALDSKVNCFVTVTKYLALEQARKAEQEIKSKKYRGPLHGIPYAVKDLLATKGIRTTWGSRLFADQVPDYDGAVVEKLRDAGAILLGKLSMTELAGGPAHAALNGIVHNPWKLSHWTTGSSTGPGACAAAGFAGFAIGSETTASILDPATACGVAGFRPTYGRVSRYGAMPLSWTMDKLGPLARCVWDCATVFQAIHGADPRDPSSVTAPFQFDPKAKLTGRRIGIVKREFDRLRQQKQHEPYDAAFDVLKQLGCVIEEVDLPDFPYREVSRFIWQIEGATTFEPYARKGQLQEALINKNKWFGWKAAMLIPAADYMKVLRIRHAIVLEAQKLFQRYDALLAPRNPNGARPIAASTSRPPDAPADPNPPNNTNPDGPTTGPSLLTMGNIAGLPGVAAPCGITQAGLPIGLTFVGGAMTDGKVLEIAHGYQQATTWHHRRPTFAE
ncbi:MAG: amidase [Acidobacteria bacterium]|nr:amidase [Acidobacteriota bacterium]